MIPYGKQSISQDDIDAVAEILQSPFLTQGPVVTHFEKALAEYCQASECVAVSNGTAALHLACMALGLGPGDRLWTSPLSFVASANCARYCGAAVDFVDIDPTTGNISPEQLKAKLERAEQAGQLPKIVVAVHYTGNPCELKAIRQLLNRYQILLIEDACHALGAEYESNRIGCGRYSDLTVFSFHPVKIITTGEGGAVVGNNPIWMQTVRALRSHGITKDPAQMVGDSEGGWYYEQLELGYNYRLTDLQAALGLSQLSRIPEFIRKRRALAAVYDEQLAALPCESLAITAAAASSYHLYVIKVDPQIRRELYDFLHRREIAVQVHYTPIHLQPYYRQLGFADGDFPEAERFYRSILSLPIYPDLSRNEVGVVLDALGEFFP